ncbi:MAG: SprT-like domain-containing protein [Planctomycetes bacterium]|nr:SprT-like domain-containing protein [Planctomycetota bacterium]
MNEKFISHLTSFASLHSPDVAINREDWLNNGLDIFRDAFREMKTKLPDEIRVSCGWPKGRSKAIGQVFAKTASQDGHFEIFVSPEIADAARALDILLHEICHIAAGIENGHLAPFKRFAMATGLTGKMTATVASDELLEAFNTGVIPNLGEYPHAQLTGACTGKKKQTTRMIKLECPTCGMVIRTTKTWIENTGQPICACDGQSVFEEDDGGD